MEVRRVTVKLTRPFANLYRKRHVLIAILDNKGNLILGKKDFYPPGISRLVGGGVDEGESYRDAARREIIEETGIKDSVVTPLVYIRLNAITLEGNYNLETAIFFSKINSDKIIPGDDINGIISIRPEGLIDLSKAYDNLTGTFKSDNYSHNWSDYGKVYGKIHRIVHEELVKQKLIS